MRVSISKFSSVLNWFNRFFQFEKFVKYNSNIINRIKYRKSIQNWNLFDSITNIILLSWTFSVSHIHESIRTVRPKRYIYHCWKHIGTKWPIKYCAGKNSSSQLHIMIKDRINLLQNLFLSTGAVLVSNPTKCFQNKLHSCTKQEFRLDVKKLYGGLIDN